MGFLLREEKENLLTEYNLLREEILDRSYKTWVISIVLIVGSLLVAFTPTTVIFPLPVLSLLLIAVALILHATSERVLAVAYIRMYELEKKLGITGPTRMYELEIAGQWWYSIRRSIAYVLFVILIGVYLFLLLNDYLVLFSALGVGFAVIILKERYPYEKTREKNSNR